MLVHKPLLGVDLGIKIFAALSNGERVYAACFKRLDRSIRRTQKQLARCVKGSNRRDKARLKLARLHAKLTDTRKDFLHKLSTRLVRDNNLVVLEDLAVSNMVKNRKLARAISQQGWSMFRAMCEAKANQYLDREVRVIDRWQPTSQICSSCGNRWGKLDLKIREIVCLGCGQTHCRDVNAAKVINNVGVGHIHDIKRTQRERKSASAAILSEASTPKVEWEQLSLPI